MPEKTSKKKHKNDLLVRRDNIENMSSNCYFYGKNAPKFVSVNSYGRVAYRFVLRVSLPMITLQYCCYLQLFSHLCLLLIGRDDEVHR